MALSSVTTSNAESSITERSTRRTPTPTSTSETSPTSTRLNPSTSSFSTPRFLTTKPSPPTTSPATTPPTQPPTKNSIASSNQTAKSSSSASHRAPSHPTQTTNRLTSLCGTYSAASTTGSAPSPNDLPNSPLQTTPPERFTLQSSRIPSKASPNSRRQTSPPPETTASQSRLPTNVCPPPPVSKQPLLKPSPTTLPAMHSSSVSQSATTTTPMTARSPPIRLPHDTRSIPHTRYSN
jgi:hypothetical protein